MKSSLSKYRDKVSSDFFKEIFESDLVKSNETRQTFRGLHIYAIDGDQLDLPASRDVFSKGYRGYPISKSDETHYPKMYTVQALDVINGRVQKFACSNKFAELNLARTLVGELEKESLTIYDRLYACYDTLAAHEKIGSYFLVRARSENSRLAPVVAEFYRSKRRSIWTEFLPAKTDRALKNPIPIRLIKVRNKKTGKDFVFMTNLPEGRFRNKEIGELYQRRWAIESSFKDLTDTLTMGQWHSKKLDGILQEIYALLWFVNNVRRMTSVIKSKSDSLLERRYRKSNFKFIAILLIEHLDLLIKKHHRKLERILHFWAEKSAENREHLLRSYPRQVRSFGKKYRNASRAPRGRQTG